MDFLVFEMPHSIMGAVASLACGAVAGRELLLSHGYPATVNRLASRMFRLKIQLCWTGFPLVELYTLFKMTFKKDSISATYSPIGSVLNTSGMLGAS